MLSVKKIKVVRLIIAVLHDFYIHKLYRTNKTLWTLCTSKVLSLGLKKIYFFSDFRPTLSKHVRPKFILWIFKKKKKKKKK